MIQSTTIWMPLKEHIKDDVEVDEKVLRESETDLNRHSAQLAKDFRIGAAWGHEPRVKEAVTAVNSLTPNTYGLRKNHKPEVLGQEITGPKVRPVCGAKEAPNSRLGQIAADIINMVADFIEKRKGSKSTISTEEMAAGILKYNKMAKLRKRKRILMSMDVKGLYPNLEVEEVLKIIKEMVEKSGLNFEGVDWVEVGKHLAVCVSRQDLDDLNLSEVVPKRKGADRRVTMAYLDGGNKSKKNIEKWGKLWNMPERMPNEVEKANMISKLIEIVTKEVMSNHFYSVGDTIRKQTDGGL